MQPGDTIDLSPFLYATRVDLPENKAYYVLVDSSHPILKYTICLVARNKVDYRRGTALKVYYEGFWEHKCRSLDVLFHFLPLEDMPVLACHHSSGVRSHALERLSEGR